MPKRVQLSRRRGWRMPEGAIKVDRSTHWGNPFPVDARGQAMAVALFRRWIEGRMIGPEMRLYEGLRQDVRRHSGTSLRHHRDCIRDRLHELRGRDLACWCKPGEPCHADVLLELANAEDGAR